MNGRLDANIRDSIRARQIHSVVPAMVSLVNNRFAGLLSRNMAPHASNEDWILEVAKANFAQFLNRPNRPNVAMKHLFPHFEIVAAHASGCRMAVNPPVLFDLAGGSRADIAVPVVYKVVNDVPGNESITSLRRALSLLLD